MLTRDPFAVNEPRLSLSEHGWVAPARAQASACEGGDVDDADSYDEGVSPRRLVHVPREASRNQDSSRLLRGRATKSIKLLS